MTFPRSSDLPRRKRVYVPKPRDEFTLADFQKIIDYNPETGAFTWKINRRGHYCAGKPVGSVDDAGYRVMSICGRMFKAHRLAWLFVYGCWPSKLIDHINRDKSDNRICNLREACHSENNINTGLRGDNTSGVRGVSWCSRTKRWMAQICVRKQYVFLGRFASKEEAAAAYNDAAVKGYSEFAEACE